MARPCRGGSAKTEIAIGLTMSLWSLPFCPAFPCMSDLRSLRNGVGNNNLFGNSGSCLSRHRVSNRYPSRARVQAPIACGVFVFLPTIAWHVTHALSSSKGHTWRIIRTIRASQGFEGDCSQSAGSPKLFCAFRLPFPIPGEAVCIAGRSSFCDGRRRGRWRRLVGCP